MNRRHRRGWKSQSGGWPPTLVFAAGDALRLGAVVDGVDAGVMCDPTEAAPSSCTENRAAR